MKNLRTSNWAAAAIGIVMAILLPVLLKAGFLSDTEIATAIGRFHMPVLHFPIALLLIVPVLEILGMTPRWRHLGRAVPAILVMCAVFSVITCVLGMLLAAGEGIRGTLLNAHLLAGIMTTVLVIAMVLYRISSSENRSLTGSAVYVLLMAGSIASLVIGSHHGASMVHGEDYLFAHLPDKIKTFLHLPVEEEIALDYDSQVYHSIIAPILKEHCYSCHGDSITKGNFRMDEYAMLLTGGKSELPAIVPGDSQTSELFRRITLDRNHKETMPPVDEPPLQPNDVSLIQWWIDAGAPQKMTLDGVSMDYYPKDIESIITTMIRSTDPVDPLDWTTLQAVAADAAQAHGVDVIPYSQDPGDGAYVVARNSTVEITKATLDSLAAIAPHVHSINLWNQTLVDGALSGLEIFSNLEELHLNQTNVGDADLKHLTELRRLRSLNLHGTGITDTAIENLSRLRSLRKLFLADSHITSTGIQLLRENLPNCTVLWRDPMDIPVPTPEEIDIESSEFDAVPGWGVTNVGQHDHGIGSTHGGIAVDNSGQIHVSSKSGIHVYSDTGERIKSYTGADYSDFHSLLIVEEDGEEFIYGARNRDGEVMKLRMNGEIVLRIPFPSESKVEGKFMPTAALPLPDGRIFVTDGYGTNRVFSFDASGSYLSLFGGKDEEDPAKFHTPHGISLDTRFDPARLLISDREKRRLVHFDLEGNFIGEIINGLRRPCATAILGEYIAVAELEGRVIILDGENNIIHELGDNPDKSQWANFKVAPEAWQDGIHTAPHGLDWDAAGNLYVQDWNSHGRISKWERKPVETGY